MQTFLPYPDFHESARCLDRQRLEKQRVEVLQLMKAIWPGIGGWTNHPATKMWACNFPALCQYGIAVCDEWISRGYKDTCRSKIRYQWAAWHVHALGAFQGDIANTEVQLPTWLGDLAFHASHRSNLLRKDPVWYGQFGWTESDNLPYVWPV